MRAGGVAKHERMWWHIARHHRASADQCKLADCHTTSDHRPTTNRRAISHQRRRHFPIVRCLEFALRRNGAWGEIIGEANMRPHKHTVLKRDTFKDRRMVLYLHPRANTHVRVHEDAFANVALFADACVTPDMSLTPDAGSGADFGSRLY